MKENLVWEDLLIKEIPHIRRCVTKYIRDPELAKDLAQDVLLHALEHKHKYCEDNLKGWLAVLTRNLFINQYRRDVIGRNRVQVTDSLYDSDLLKHCYVNTAPSQLNMEELIGDINKLKPKIREAMLERAKNEKYEEIAQSMGVLVGSVRSLLHRGREQLNRNKYA